MSGSLAERLARAAQLDPALFEEVAGDEAAGGAALAVVFGAALLEGLGRGGGPDQVLLGVAGACLRWGVWVCAIHLGASLLGLGRGLAPLFRALGFAAAPFALGLLEVVPLLGGVAWLAKWVFGFAAFAVATRRVLQSEIPTAALLCAVALAVALLASAPLR